jgi:hypothetical protein
MRCADDATLWAFARGELAADARAQLESHVVSCSRCREALARVETSLVLLRGAAADPPQVKWSEADRAIIAAATSHFAARARWRVLGALATLGAASALALVLFWMWMPRGVEITVEAASGAGLADVRAVGRGEEAMVEAGDVLRSGASLRTSADGSALLRLSDSSRARLGAHTGVTFSKADREAVELRLDAGALAVETAHVERRSFFVQAGSVRVTVVGTVFRVERHEERVAVAVARGRVRVEADERPVQFVDAGRRLVLGTGGNALAEGALTREDDEAFLHLGFVPERRESADVAPEPVANLPANPPASASAPSKPASTPGSRSRTERKRAPAAKHPGPPPAQGRVDPPPAVADNSSPPSGVNPTTPPTPGIGGPPVGSLPSSALVPGGGAPSGLDADWAIPQFRRPEDRPAETPADPPAPPSSLAERARTSGLPITAEGLFLQRAKESILESTCPRYMAGLAEVVDTSRDPRSREMARILRARCFDEQRLPHQAEFEYRRYLQQFPGGRFAAEARGALRR